MLDVSWPGECGADFQLAFSIFATFAALLTVQRDIDSVPLRDVL
jgi:hypothetical protein